MASSGRDRSRSCRVGVVAALFVLCHLKTLFQPQFQLNTNIQDDGPTSTLTRTSVRRTYHSWDDKGANFEPVLERLNYSWSDEEEESPFGNDAVAKRVATKCQPFPVFIAITDNQQQHPVLFLSQRTTREIRDCAMVHFRVVLPHFQTALRTQLLQNLDRFPALVAALKRFPLIPFYIDYADYRGCPVPSLGYNYDQVKRLMGMPYLSICKSTRCPWGFPIPTHVDYEVAVDLMQEWNRTYPWHEKIPKANWRGGLKNFRAAVLQQTNKFPFIFDAKVATEATRQLKDGPLLYKAVLDMDGNSWSERFPRLLCYNTAVILVVAPEGADDYEEYIMQDLTPNVHFIPASVENVTEVVTNIFNGSNDDFLLSVVQEANAFCRARLVPEELNMDFLSVLNGYMETLDKYDKDWILNWQHVHSSYVGPGLGHEGFWGSKYVVDTLSNPPKWNLTELDRQGGKRQKVRE